MSGIARNPSGFRFGWQAVPRPGGAAAPLPSHPAAAVETRLRCLYYSAESNYLIIPNSALFLHFHRLHIEIRKPIRLALTISGQLYACMPCFTQPATVTVRLA